MKIRFKTTEPFFSKEKRGDKNNTVRSLSEVDTRFADLLFIIRADAYNKRKDIIEITNIETKENFKRIITDVTYYDDRFIISWRHIK